MLKYQNNLTDRSGNAVPNVEVTVTTTGGVLAQLYSDDGVTPKPNPLTTDANGYIEFYAADDRYNITVGGAGGYQDVEIYDVRALDVAAAKKADLASNTGSSQVGFLQSGVSSVVTTTQAKLRERVSILDKMNAAQIADAFTGVSTADHSVFFQKAGDEHASFEIPGAPYVFNVNTPVSWAKPVRMTGPGAKGYTNIKTTIQTGPVFQSTVGDFEVDGVGFEGDGTFNIVTPIANPFSFLKVTSTKYNFKVSNCTFKNFRTLAVDCQGVLNVLVEGNLAIGGPASFVDGNLHVMVLGSSSNRLRVQDNQIIPNPVTGGRCGNVVLVATQFSITDVTGEASTVSRYFEYSGNMAFKLWSYSVYGILPRAAIIRGNWHIYSGDPICNCGTEVYPDTSRYPGVIVEGNVGYADPALAATSTQYAIALRNAAHVRIANNLFVNYGNGLQITPNSARTGPGSGTISTVAVSRDITFESNSLINYRGNGVQIAMTSGDGAKYANVYDITIRGNRFSQLENDADILSTGSLVSALFTTGPLINGLTIEGNTCDGSGSYLLSLTGIRGLYVKNNRLKNPGRHASGGKYGMNLNDVQGFEFIGTEIKDDRGSPVMTLAIVGNNTTTKGVVRGCTLLGWTTAVMSQMTPAGHKTSFDDNKSGDDALDGIVTLGAAATTVVNNANAHSGGAYQRYVTLVPINAAAAQMTAKRPYVSSQVIGTSFTLSTGDGTAAAGTEQFYYKLNG